MGLLCSLHWKDLKGSSSASCWQLSNQAHVICMPKEVPPALQRNWSTHLVLLKDCGIYLFRFLSHHLQYQKIFSLHPQYSFILCPNTHDVIISCTPSKVFMKTAGCWSAGLIINTKPVLNKQYEEPGEPMVTHLTNFFTSHVWLPVRYSSVHLITIRSLPVYGNAVQILSATWL